MHIDLTSLFLGYIPIRNYIRCYFPFNLVNIKFDAYINLVLTQFKISLARAFFVAKIVHQVIFRVFCNQKMLGFFAFYFFSNTNY